MGVNPTLEKIARRFEPPIQKAMLKAFIRIKDLNTLREIEEALLRGGVQGAMSLIEGKVAPIIGQEIIDDLDDAITASGRASIGIMPEGAVVDPDFRFSMMNPNTAAFVQQYEMNLVRELSQETLDAVRQGIIADVVTGRNPRLTARDFRANIGLTQTQETAVRNYRKYLEELDPQALQRELRDKRFDSTIKNAISKDEPLSQRQITKMTDRYRQKSIKYRAEVIARTEALRATSIGNQEAVDQMLAENAIDPNTRKFWSPTRDERTRADHMAIPGMNPEGVPLDGMFLTPKGPLKYPRDPAGTAANTVQCRCGVVYRLKK